MNIPKISKTDLYKATAYTVLMLLLAFPASMLGLKLLNFLLGNINF